MTSFKSEILTAVRHKLGIGAQFSSPYHAQGHAKAERANRTILEMLRKFIWDNPTSWDEMLHFFLFRNEGST